MVNCIKKKGNWEQSRAI